MRLFVGTFIELPERKSIELFQESNADLQLKNGATIKWSPAAKLHITWCFLGDVDSGKVDLLKDGINSALQDLKSSRGEAATPESLIFTRMAFWPQTKFPHIIVLRPDRTDKYFADLANLITAKTQSFVKVAGEQKEFRAHITLARVRNSRSSDGQEKIPDDTSKGRISNDTAEDKRCSEKARLSEQMFRGQEQLFPLEVKLNRIELIESSQIVEGGYRSVENFDLI
jgi:2'-5' RNA ligase